MSEEQIQPGEPELRSAGRKVGTVKGVGTEGWGVPGPAVGVMDGGEQFPFLAIFRTGHQCRTQEPKPFTE
ncbi:hypothetical protein M514_10598 [Trichuris suis]|uniref:Uncharacterized protein n=1 Tax=Trichuris suis TaxID=68888 RepID=A0A085MS55_9BILA|nr:hypothetical protein M514_10598 [Trichuris suis]